MYVCKECSPSIFSVLYIFMSIKFLFKLQKIKASPISPTENVFPRLFYLRTDIDQVFATLHFYFTHGKMAEIQTASALKCYMPSSEYRTVTRYTFSSLDILPEFLPCELCTVAKPVIQRALRFTNFFRSNMSQRRIQQKVIPLHAKNGQRRMEE